jgi:glycosyltransferase involved in cell wall biosynthesis
VKATLEKKKLVFVSWAESCSRSDSIARRLGGVSFMIYSPFWGSRYSTVVFKYLSQILKTLRLLFRCRPDVVFVMTPPVIACIPVWLFARFTGAQYIIDAHSGAFVDKRWIWTLSVHKFFSRRAATTVVTGDFLAAIVRGWGAKAMIVTDVPVYFAEPRLPNLESGINMAFISTFTRDEPFEAFMAAACLVPEVHFNVTGRLKDADPRMIGSAPRNVNFTDYLSDSDYAGLLKASDAVICLTTADHTMQRGAYEAVYLGRPVITSDFGILRNSFPRGTVFVNDTPEAIAEGIREMRDKLKKYESEAETLRLDKLERWRAVEDEFQTYLGTVPATNESLTAHIEPDRLKAYQLDSK